MSFVPMDPDVIKRLIADEVDVITPAAARDAEIYKHARCPACGNEGAEKVILPPKILQGPDGDLKVLRSPFSTNSLIPQGHAKCQGCGTEFLPSTGVIVKADQPILTQVFGITDDPQ